MTHGRRRWWVLFNAFVVNLSAGGFAWVYITLVVPDVLADLGLAMGDWGVLWGGIALGVLALSIPAGIVGDRFGPRRTVGVGLAICGGALLLRADAQGFETMLASMVLLGCGFAFIFTNLPKALGTWFPSEQLGLANGLSLAGLGCGQGLAALTTPLFVSRLGSWRDLSEISGYGLIAVAIGWTVAVADAPSGSSSRHGPPLIDSMRRVLRVRGVWIAALCYLLYLGGHLSAAGYLPAYFSSVRGISPELTGLIVSLGPWGFIAGSAILPMLSDRIGRRKIVFVTAICTIAAAVFVQAYLLGIPLATASLLWGFSAGAVGLIFVVPIELDRVGPELAGTAFGVITCFGFLGGWIFPAVGLSLAEMRPLAAFVFFASCYILAAALFAALPETGPGRLRAASRPETSGPADSRLAS